MKIPNPFRRSAKTAPAGNPAYPSLKKREKIVAKNQTRPEPVKKPPADELHRPSQD